MGPFAARTGKKTVSFPTFYTKTDQFTKTGLGTNIGKALKNETVFSQAAAAAVDIEDEIRFRGEVTSQRQAAEVMAAKPRPSYTPVQWGWVDLELHVKKKKEWATPSMQYDSPDVLNGSQLQSAMEKTMTSERMLLAYLQDRLRTHLTNS
eukprot:COSAG06_NODE_383_length_16525_cov_86.720017_10_plen_150_part_00